MRVTKTQSGIFFLANDTIFDMAVAFLNSLRATTILPVCLIPFNSHIEKLKRIIGHFDVSLFDNESILKRCDEISVAFHGTVLGHYRKLAAWEGPFDHFVYIDTDTIVQEDVAVGFQFLGNFEYVLSQSRFLGSRQWVWKGSHYELPGLSREQTDFSGNTGYICSRRGILSVKEAEAKLPAALKLTPHMELLCFEQPFLNYLIVTSGLGYTSLREVSVVNPELNLPRELWAGTPGARVVGGRIVMTNRKPILFVHWAGNWARKDPRRTPLGDPTNRFVMPYDNLWIYYRDLNKRTTG